jgi:hypothetical protein
LQKERAKMKFRLRFQRNEVKPQILMPKSEEHFFDAKSEACAEAREEFREYKRWRGCRDRMCGATDCPTCYPGSWDDDENSDEDEEDENTEEESAD